MGSGKNGTFDKHPDWQQWAILAVHKSIVDNNYNKEIEILQQLYGAFIQSWFNFFKCETFTIILDPIEGHGKWDGKIPFGELPKSTDYNGMVAILTRATIRYSKLKSFWKNVEGVANQMAGAKGFITSFGIGEVPYIKQATFSIWENKTAMKEFAYKMTAHTVVIQKTRKENWYSEDMFVRFRPIKTYGTLKGINPLGGKL